MSPEGGWSDSEADRRSAGVKALVPDRDREIFGAECKRARKVNGISSAELMGDCKRAGNPLDVG